MTKKINLTEEDAKNSPQGGYLVGKKNGQTMIYSDGTVGGWFVGKTHKEGGIQGIDKTTGQPIEVQTSEVIITAPALADQTPREFQGKMMTNRQILSKINSDAGGVSFAEEGMEVSSKILCNGGSYKYGGKMMSDKEIADEINKCGCDHDEKKHLSEGMSLEDIAKKHGVTLEELDKQVEIGMEDESIHAGDYKDHFNIVKDHLVESPTFYTDEQNAQGENKNFEFGGDIKSLYENKNDYIKYLVERNLTDGVELYKLHKYLKSKNLDVVGLLPDNVKKDPEYIKVKRDYDLAFARLRQMPIYKYPKNRDRVQESKDRKIAQSITDKIIQIKLKKEKFVNGGEMKKENLVKDAKNGNTPARDLNNYNDMLDVQADGQVGGDSGIYKDGGAVGNKKEYEYILTQRPFDIGTYPKENFIRFEQQKYQFGVVIYSKPIPIREIKHFSLCPITEIKDFNNKFLYYLVSDTKQKIQIKLIPDKRIGYFVDIIYYDGDKVEDTQMISAVKFLENIQEGHYKLENEIKDEPKKEKEVSKKEKSFESEGSTEGKGKLYEFFTPQIVADKMLALAQHYGFKGGNVLEPATGSGRLIKNLKNTNITAFEISKDNFEILKREFPNAELYNFNFEKAFLKEPRFNTLLNRKGTETWLKNAPFDLVMANPPYGKFSGLYSSYFKFKGQVEHFFILQTLHLLKKGGLGVYLIPSSFMRNGIAYNDIKKEIFEIAELVDAYRLPSNIFEKTQIGTDILILRKK